jgi:hypothetical protein
MNKNPGVDGFRRRGLGMVKSTTGDLSGEDLIDFGFGGGKVVRCRFRDK